MTITRRGLIGAAIILVAPSSTRAQTPPLARIICGFPAGGTADATARHTAELWRGKLAGNVIVENRVGAAGRIAVTAVKDAPGDGSMLLLSPESMFTIHASVYRKLGYDPDKDITPVSPISRFAFALGVGPGVPDTVKALADFVSWAKANGDKISYGSPAAGSMPHFLGDQFFRAIGSGAGHTPYRGSAPALQDLVGGHVPAVMTVLGDFLPFKTSPVCASSQSPTRLGHAFCLTCRPSPSSDSPTCRASRPMECSARKIARSARREGSGTGRRISCA